MNAAELDDAGDAAPPEHAQPAAPAGPSPAKKIRGVCSVCGRPARKPTATQCEEHATPQAKKRERQRQAERPSSSSSSSPGTLRGDLTAQLAMVGAFWAMRFPPLPTPDERELVFGDLPPEVVDQFRNPGEVAIEQAPELAAALVALAEKNQYVRMALETATSGAPVFMLIQAALPIYQANALYSKIALPRMVAAAERDAATGDAPVAA